MIYHHDHTTSQGYPDLSVMESIVRLIPKGNAQIQVTSEIEKWLKKNNKEEEWKQAVKFLTSSKSGQPPHEIIRSTHPSEKIVKKIKQQLSDLPNPDNSGTMGHLFLCLQDYILKKAKGASIAEKEADGDDTGFRITWKEKVFQFQLSSSPFWQCQQTDMPLVSIGPLMDNGLMEVSHLFLKPKVRQNLAFFDPWAKKKINIVKDGLFSYVDWFFRDQFKIKFGTPQQFSQMLMDYQILRYDIG